MSVLDTLFGGQRQRALGWLLLHPDQPLHVRELARLTSSNAGSLHRDLTRLANAELLLRSTQGNQVRYQANRASPVFEELSGLFRKTSGAMVLLEEALEPLRAQIEVAFVFGSFARGEEHAQSDIDVLLVGNLDFVDAVRALHPFQDSLKREINPVVYSREEFSRKRSEGDRFIRELLAGPRLFIQGSENDIGKLAGHS
jgi:predicted nucleotidyltransferase